MKNLLKIFVILLYYLTGESFIVDARELFADRYNFTYITMNEGLESNSIKDLFKDSSGFLWVATAGGGLSRYDGYDFVHYTINTSDCKLKSNFIETICQDSFSRLWVTSEGGIDVIDLLTHHTALPDDPTGELANIVNRPALRAICDTKGGIWVFCQPALFHIEFNPDGNIAKIRKLPMVITPGPNIAMADIDSDGYIWMGAGNEIHKITFDGDDALKANPVAQCLNFEAGVHIFTFLAKENEVWIATDLGLYRFNRNGNVVKHYQYSSGDNRSLSQNYLTDLAVTVNKQLIISTLKGINIYNPISDDFEQIVYSQPESKKLLNSNFIDRMLTDGNRIWLGTETGGINKMEPGRLLFRDYVYDKDNPASISANPVNAVYESPDGTLWVGTVEGGLNRKDKNSESFTHYTAGSSSGLSHNSVSALTVDNKNRLWIGTWGGGINLMELKAPYRVTLRISQSTEHYPINFIGTLIYDSINSCIWIGANNGIYFYDLQAKRLFSFLGDDTSERLLGCIGSIIDRKGQLWIGSMDGVYIIDLHSRSLGENKFNYRHLRYKLNQPELRIIEKITCFCQTDDSTLWLGSNGYGIYKCTTGKDGIEKFTAYTTENGLPNNSIRGILQDKNGSLWISTNYGLSCYNPANNQFSNYTTEDGLIDNQFYWNASCRSSAGTLLFGGVSGLTVIEGEREDIDRMPSTVRLTRLKVENREIEPVCKYISEDISTCRILHLHERDKSFSVEFSALNFNPIATAMYSYRLLGFNDKWVNVPASRRFADYTNLPSGSYIFQVKYIADGLTGEEPVTELQIIVKPFFYKTVWFILLMFAVVALSAWQLYQWRIRSMKHQLIQMAQKVEEATVDKLSFFTNITHEFRTPLTLITGPIERALKLSYNPMVIEQLHFVERNSKYLLSLINQLMDFRKIESGKMELVKTNGNFLSFVDSLVAPFHVFAAERNITVRQYYRLNAPSLLFDEDAMNKVLTNLLSNAVKFTPNGGKVSLYITAVHRPETGAEELYLCVSDDGNGIAEGDIAHIFDRFYQSRNNIKYPSYGNTGTGIGLYLCKHIVQMHGGEINVKNNRGAGCSFRIFLPLLRGEDAGKNEPVKAETQQNKRDSLTYSTSSKLTILVVEDNADMRGYIRSILSLQYNVIEATNGAEALSLLNTHAVDFIVSDLMMPVMDGIELSQRVKESFSISHIPFLMLTAKTSNEAKLESFRTGVDEYLLKPFDETLLLARIENILENRKRYQRKFSLEMNIDVLPLDEESSDKKFLNRIMEVVKQNFKNSYFEVSDFTEAMGVSKSLLNNKLQNLTGQSAGQFMRNYRLNIARELILKNRETKNMNISEVAYEVGFNDPKYFTRCFTKHFNITPSGMLEGESISPVRILYDSKS